MIEKDFGRFVGVCDVCGEVTPRFATWAECRDYILDHSWGSVKNKKTGEWENLCPECKKLKNY